jgi:hypothetical protein
LKERKLKKLSAADANIVKRIEDQLNKENKEAAVMAAAIFLQKKKPQLLK